MVCLRQVEVCLRCVLRPLVTVEDKSISDLFSLQSFANGICNERRTHIRTHFPRKNNLAAQIQHSAHVQHFARNRNIGDVRHPELVGRCLIETSIQKIWILMNGLPVAGIWSAAAKDLSPILCKRQRLV